MEKDFWLQCWQKNHIAFHQLSFHPWLTSVIKEKLPAQPIKTFIPLCGKSDDIVWFSAFGNVVGSELSEIACRDFFAEKGYKFSTKLNGEHALFQHENIELWQGDFFKLTPEKLGDFDVVYDRAALVALPKQMQLDYVNHLKQFIDTKTKLFLIAVAFNDDDWQGPPFSITDDDIQQLFSSFSVEKIAEHKLSNNQFAQRKMAVGNLKEALYLIQK